MFRPRAYNNNFCCRSCFRKAYRSRFKVEEEARPTFLCPNCRRTSELDFSPKLDERKWLEYVCECGYCPRGSRNRMEESDVRMILS